MRKIGIEKKKHSPPAERKWKLCVESRTRKEIDKEQSCRRVYCRIANNMGNRSDDRPALVLLRVRQRRLGGLEGCFWLHVRDRTNPEGPD